MTNRAVFFLAALGIHAALLFFLVFKMTSPAVVPEPAAGVMKLLDIQEFTPPPPPPPPERPPELAQNTVEAIAETMVETDVLPDDLVIVDSLPPVLPPAAEVYLAQGKISVIPVLPDEKIRQATVYPPIALRSGIEGMVYLELFIDRYGEIRQISILREDPAGRGFGEAAVKAFSGITAMSPAFANGVAVGVRYRYPMRFSIKP